MSRTNRQSARKPNSDRDIDLLDALLRREELEALLDVDVAPANDVAAPTPMDDRLEDVLRAQRWQLLAIARHRLGRRHEADCYELVDEACEEALAGQLALSPDPNAALGELRAEIAARCTHRNKSRNPDKRGL